MGTWLFQNLRISPQKLMLSTLRVEPYKTEKCVCVCAYVYYVYVSTCICVYPASVIIIINIALCFLARRLYSFTSQRRPCIVGCITVHY